MDVSQQQLLWSATNGGGLSLLRNHINPDTGSSTGETGTMQKAQQMGATIFSSPWSPPAQWKTNNNVADIVNGVQTNGTLKSGVDPSSGSGLTYYQEYANWLTQYVINMHNQGITVSAVSMQNEPNWQASYESCIYSPQQFHDILAVLENTLAGNTSTYPLGTYPYLANVKIILPEEIHWNNLDLVSQVMSDPVESNYANLIYADHTYGINTVDNNVYPGKDGYAPMSLLYPSALNPGMNLNGHQVWETEHTGTDPSVGIQAALDEATSIYDIVYIAQASAYNHWWIWAPNTTGLGGGASLVGGLWQWTKDFSGMANFSKFIRPGWVGVGESDDNNGLRISAFKNPATGDFATVLINSSAVPVTETINLNGAYSPVLTPWVTTATMDVAQQQSIPATGNGGSYSYTVPAKSIVTLTGTATTTPLTEVPVGLLPTAATTSTITLSWTSNLASATGYTVQRSSDGVSWTTLTTSLSSSTYTYTDSGLPTNTLYYYRVQANNGTLYSNVVTEMTQPPAPSGLTASYSTSTQNVTLNWTRNGSSVTDYAVDVSTDGGSTWTTQSAGISSSSSSFTDTVAPELATLQYRVRAVYGLNSSAPTNVVTVTTTVLKAPTGLTVTAGGTSAVLNWTDNTNTNSTVSIERSTDGTNWSVRASVNHGVQTYTDSTVTEGGTYYYRIRNYDSAAVPPTYSAYATASPVTVPPAAPTHVEVEFSPLPTLMARVLWVDNATSETAYEVDRSSNGGSTWTTLTTALPSGATSYIDTTVTSGQAYVYRVEALHNTVSSASVTTLSETASALPAPFAHGDIGDAGTVGLAGSASYSAGTYTLTGAGADIWNTADGFQYAYTTLTGDGSIVTQVTSMANFVNYGKAGLMMRNSLDPSSAYAIAFLTPQGTVNFEERASAGTSSANKGSVGTFSTPEYLKLTRTGNSFAVYYGSNGTSWTQLGSNFSITMGSTIYVGLITSAHSSSQLATATFANTALTGTGNQGPTVATAASANPSPVNGTTTNLSVLGADDAGQGNLIYTWATSGTPPAPVVFSSNGQNNSKNTVATFTSAGNYTFLVTITDQFGLSTTSNVTLTVNQVLIGTSLAPAATTVAPNSSTQLTFATVDQFGNPMPAQGNVTWSIYSGTGSVSASGLYTAPANEAGLVTVRAVNDSGQTAYATIDVLNQTAWYPANATGGTLLSDVTSHGWNGTLNGAAGFGPGLSGNALNLTGGYAALPAGVVSSLSNFTIAAWVNLASIANWARIFDFGTGTNTNMFLTPKNGSTNVIRFAITTSGGGGEQQINGTSALATGSWQHVAVTLSGNVGTLYVNGVAVGTNSNMTLHPSSLGSTNQNYLGKSQYGADPALMGSLDDFRIIGRALSAAEIRQLVYPTVVTPATSSSNPVNAASTTLTALAGDVTAGEASLTYTWATIGTPPAPVVFSVNSTNSAKSTVATFTKPGSYSFQVTMRNAAGFTATSNVSLTVNTSVAGRWIFYGNSSFDAVSDDNAIAPDKSALLPGQTASFANYSSFDRGINGIMIDIAGPVGALTAADFTFAVGNDNNLAGWTAAPAPLAVTLRPGAGVGGATRVELTWADGAIACQWLQVTLLGGLGSNSNLPANDVFYFGNAIGDTGNSAADTRVTIADVLGARANTTGSAGLSNAYDFNRDGVVDPSDINIAATDQTSFLNALALISPPLPPAAPGAASGAALPLGISAEPPASVGPAVTLHPATSSTGPVDSSGSPGVSVTPMAAEVPATGVKVPAPGAPAAAISVNLRLTLERPLAEAAPAAPNDVRLRKAIAAAHRPAHPHIPPSEFPRIFDPLDYWSIRTWAHRTTLPH